METELPRTAVSGRPHFASGQSWRWSWHPDLTIFPLRPLASYGACEVGWGETDDGAVGLRTSQAVTPRPGRFAVFISYVSLGHGDLVSSSFLVLAFVRSPEVTFQDWWVLMPPSQLPPLRCFFVSCFSFHCSGETAESAKITFLRNISSSCVHCLASR